MKKWMVMGLLLSANVSAATCPGVKGKYLFGAATQPAGTVRECGALATLWESTNRNLVSRFEMFKVIGDGPKVLSRAVNDVERLGYRLVDKQVSQTPMNITLAYKKGSQTLFLIMMKMDSNLVLIDAEPK